MNQFTEEELVYFEHLLENNIEELARQCDTLGSDGLKKEALRGPKTLLEKVRKM